MWLKANRISFGKITELPEKKSITVREMKIAYTDIGDGPVVLALPPWPSSSMTYYPLSLALKDYVRIIAIDLPGWGGDSSVMTLPNTIVAYGKLISDIIRELDLKDYYLIGYSFGGVFSQELSREDVTQPKKQIFISTLHSGKSLSISHSRVLNLARFALRSNIPESLIKKVMLKFVQDYRKNHHTYLKKYWNTIGLNYMIEEDLKANAQCVIKTLLSLVDEDLLKDHKNPPESIVIYADGDSEFIKEESRDIARKLDIEPILLENTNHDHLFFDVDKSSDTILNFLLS